MADERINQIFSIDDSEAIQALERILDLTDNAAKRFEDLDQEQRQTFEELAKSLNVSEKEFNDLIKSTGKYESEIRNASRETSAFTDEVQKSFKNVRIFGISIGEATDFLNKKITALRGVVSGLGSTNKALKVFKVVLASTGIGLAVVAFGSLVSVLSKTQRGLDFVARVGAVVGSVFDNIIEALAKLAPAVALFLRGDITAAGIVARDALKGLGTEILEDAKAADRLELASQRLADRQREFSVTLARTRQRIEELRLISQDETQSRQEQQKALAEAIRLEGQLGEQQISLKEQELAILKERNSLGESLRSDLEAEAFLEAEIAEIRGQVARRQRELVRRQGTLARQAVADLQKQEKEIQKLVEDLKDVSTAYEGQEAVARRSLELQIDKLKELRQAVQDAGVADQFTQELQNVDDLISALEQRLQESTIEPLDFLSSLPDQIESQTQSFQDAGEALGRALGQGVKDEVVKLTDEQKQFLRDQFTNTFVSITDIFIQNTERQIQAQQAVIDSRQQAIDDLESQLAEEQRLRDRGFANNAESLEAAVTTETQLLEQEEQKRLGLEKKAARERLVINSLLQASETITAVTKLISAETPKGVVGLIIAAAGVAFLFSILAQAKAQATEFATVPQFRTGTEYVEGPGTETSDSVLSYLGRGERVVDAFTNRKIGGAAVSNDELFQNYAIGKKIKDYLNGETASLFSMPYHLPAILKSISENKEAAAEMELQQRNRNVERAVTKAIDRQTETIISYLQTRPTEWIDQDGATVFERKLGSTVERRRIKDQSKNADD